MLTGEDLAAARNRARLTQQQLADRLGVTLRSVGNWERSQAVPSGAESKVRDVLASQLGNQPDLLSSVSDARLLAEIAKRFERAREDGEGHVPATTNPASDELAQEQYGQAARRGRKQKTDEPGDGA